MHLFEEFAQAKLEGFILPTLVEFADKVPACAEGVEAECQRCEAQILIIGDSD